MTVETTTARVTYTGAGTTGPFSVPFYFLKDEDLKVIKTAIADNTETTLVLTTDYVVSGAADEAGGSVTLTASLSSAYKLTIIRDPDLLQSSDYPPNDKFPATTHERVVDKLTMIAQRLKDLINRSFRLSDGDVSGISLSLSNLSASKLIAVNSAGTALEAIAAADVGLTPVSDFAATLLDDADASAARTTLGAASLGANTFTGLQTWKASADIASGATIDLGAATGNSVTVTHTSGTLAITSLGGASLQAGTEIETIFSISGGTLSLTHHATNLILAGGANITLANGDTIRWRKMHNSNAEWKMVGGVKADGTAWVVAASGVTLDSPITMATGSPTIIEISTSIPAGTKRIDIGVAGGSTNSTSNWLVQIGDSGGFETAGYVSGATNDNATRATSTAGFIVTNIENATYSRSGIVTLLLIDAATNTWVESGQFTETGSGLDSNSAGSKSLSGELTSVRLTTVGGSAIFDAGTLAIQYS